MVSLGLNHHMLTAEVRNKPYEIADMFIDIGASSDQQVAEWGFIQEIW